MVTVIKRFGARFFALFVISFSTPSVATDFLPHTNVSVEIADQLTACMAALPSVCDGDGFVIRHATPQDIANVSKELADNKLLAASLADRLYYNIDENDILAGCLLALLETGTPSHPNAFMDTEKGYIERIYAVSKQGEDGEEDEVIGFIHTNPGLKEGRVVGRTELSCSGFHAYRGKGYAAMASKGFLAYLKGLQGKKLAQFTLPDQEKCQKAMGVLLATGTDKDTPSLVDLGLVPKPVLLTEFQAWISLLNPTSFIPASRNMYLLGINNICSPTDFCLETWIPGEGEQVEKNRQALNALLVFSSNEPVQADESDGPAELTVALRTALQAYVDAGRAGREKAFRALFDAAMAHPVGHTMV